MVTSKSVMIFLILNVRINSGMVVIRYKVLAFGNENDSQMDRQTDQQIKNYVTIVIVKLEHI